MHLTARVANRLGRRWGIRPYPWSTDCAVAEGSKDHGKVFDAIATSNFWGSDESLSGVGSTKERAVQYAPAFKKLVRSKGIRLIFDAPCGDLNWMPALIDETGLSYIGGDVSEVVVEAARKRRPDYDLRVFDIRNDPFPDVDLWHCRDCLFHLSFEDGLAALRNFSRSKVPYALITTNTARLLRNLDIETGGWRLVDLERAPYRLPKPLARLPDHDLKVDFPRYVALWRREQIADAVAGSGHGQG